MGYKKTRSWSWSNTEPLRRNTRRNLTLLLTQKLVSQTVLDRKEAAIFSDGFDSGLQQRGSTSDMCVPHDFGLRVEIPQGHLVPTVPQKLNYIHWIEDLLGSDNGATGGQVNGIDIGKRIGEQHCKLWCIGTGASCIYPLLGATINGWSFLATEILPDSVKCAGENVARNSLEEKVSG